MTRSLLATAIFAIPGVLAIGACGAASTLDQGNDPAGGAGRPATGGSANGVGGAGGDVGGASGGRDGNQATGGAGMSGTGGSTPGVPVDFTVEGVATWRGEARGAYSIIHDDVCNDSVYGVQDHAVPALTERGLRAGLGLIVGSCSNDWTWLREAIAQGHEIVNHSWSHPDLTSNRDYAAQIDRSQTTAETELDTEVTFFIFPFDRHDSTARDHLDNAGYLGARTGRYSQVSPPDFATGFDINFDVFYSSHALSGLNAYVDRAVTDGGWAMRELHGVADGSWEPVRQAADYRAHLDYVKQLVDSGDLWMDAPTEVLKYRFARERCGSPMVSGHDISFNGTGNEDCERYATSVTVIVNVPDDPPELRATQEGMPLSTSKLGSGRFHVEMNPLAGPATLSR